MSETVERIKERLGIVEVISSYIKLEKAGVNFKAKCPFHNEKTPSFSVSPSRGGFYCFGCGEKGDIFTFVEKFEGLDFKGALKVLAEKAGVPIVSERTEAKDEKDSLRAVLEESASYFEKNIEENKEALSYLKERGLKSDTIKNFRLGYSKPEWRDLLAYLRGKGFSDAIIDKAGLIKKSEEAKGKDWYDRFRGRIMFPILDPSGRVVAFSGRIFEAQSSAHRPDPKNVEPAKYINSPETPLFSKSKILYGYDKAKEGIRKWGFTLLVEGQMDLLMLHQAGFKNTVALSGTALTEEHITLMTRLSPKLVLALDADEAGLKASGKSASTTLSRGMDVKAAKLPPGMDPADLIKEDPEKWKKALREASHIIDFYMEIIEGLKYDERKFRQEISRQVLPYVARVESPIDRAHFISKIAARLRLPEEAVSEEVARFVRSFKSDSRGEIDKIYNSKIGVVAPSSEIFLRRIFSLFQAETTLKSGKFDVGKAEEKLKEILDAEDFLKMKESVTLAPDVLFEGEEIYGSHESLEEEIDGLILNLKYHMLKESFNSLMFELREKEKSGWSEEAQKLLKSCHELSREMAKIDLILKK